MSTDPLLLRLYSALQAGTVISLHGEDYVTDDAQCAPELSIGYDSITWGERVVVPGVVRVLAMTSV